MLSYLKVAAAFTASALGTALAEKAVDAAGNALRKARTAKGARRVHPGPENLNAAPDGSPADYSPFQVEVLTQLKTGAVGMGAREIFAANAEDAMAWAIREFGNLPSASIRVTAV